MSFGKLFKKASHSSNMYIHINFKIYVENMLIFNICIFK